MWNKVAVLSGDEVFNDNFSVNTLVRISSSDPTTVSSITFLACLFFWWLQIPNVYFQIKEPNVRATFRNEHVVVAIDKILYLLDKDLINGKSQNTNVLAFPENIDCLTISSDGSLIICGLSDGSMVGLCLAHMKKGLVFNVYVIVLIQIFYKKKTKAN